MRCALVQCALVMIVHELRQLLAQALVLFALMTEQDRALEQLVLQSLRQFAPQICGGCAKDQKIAGGDVVDDLIRVMLRHDGTLTLLLGPLAVQRWAATQCWPDVPILSLVCRENNGPAVFVPKRLKA
jgi:hypothetical protein